MPGGMNARRYHRDAPPAMGQFVGVGASALRPFAPVPIFRPDFKAVRRRDTGIFMLDGMRRMSQGLLGRAIMGLVMGFISLSFAIWGVGNIFVGYGAGKVATVGGVDVSSDTLRQLYQVRLQNLQQQAKRAITNDEAHQMGLDQQVLGQLISNATLDSQAQKLGLAISDKDIAQRLLTEPEFAGPTGKFDAGKFSQLLQDNGYSEQSFVRVQRGSYLRQEISDALTGDMTVPDAALDAIHRFRDETRSVEYFELPASAAGEPPAPDDAALQAFYDSRKESFRAPEYRGVVTLAIEPSKLADPAAVPDAAAQARYDAIKDQRYKTEATRKASQVVFKDDESANAASEKIKGGAKLADIAAEAKLPVADLGVVTKDGVFDKALADAIFALPVGGVSDPIKSQFGYAITEVTEATPETIKPFAEVAPEIKADIARQQAKKTIGDLRDKIEDERTSGKPLEEAAAAAGQKAVKIEAIDASGLDKNGAPVEGLDDRDALVKAVFASNIGVDNDTLNTPEGGFVWFEVTSIDPSREKPLNEVKDKVISAWKDDEIAKSINAKADAMVKRIDGGEEIAAVATELNLDVKNANDVKRVATTSVPQSVALRAFSLPVGKAGSSTGDGDGRIVFKVLDSTLPPLDKDSDVMKGVATQLKQSFGEELMTQYLNKEEASAGVTINQAEFRNAIGLADTGDQ